MPNFIIVMGGLTAVFSALCGAFQNDLKKVIAYSTCSQLGYMVVACGLGAYSVAFFHLYNHAFFKALLFLAAGSVIHAVGDEQDMRRMGGLLHYLPFTHLVFAVASLSLMGLPFLTGFYSKDLILELSFSSPTHIFVYTLLLFAAFCTAYYSARTMLLVFWGKPAGSLKVFAGAHEPGFAMTVPLVTLFLFTCFIGYFSKDLFVGLGSPFFQQTIYQSATNATLVREAEFLPTLIKQLPLVVTVLGCFVAYAVYNTKLKSNAIPFYVFFNRKWFFDSIYSAFIAYPFIKLAYESIFKAVDKGVLELVGPFGVSKVFESTSYSAKRLQTGFVYDYIAATFAAALLLLAFSLYYEVSTPIIFLFSTILVLVTLVKKSK